MVPLSWLFQTVEAKFPLPSVAQQTDFPVKQVWQEATTMRTQMDNQYKHEDHDQEKSDMRKILVKFHSQASNQGQKLAEFTQLTKFITTQTKMTEDQELDSKSPTFTESITTQNEMVEDQEMHSRSIQLTESITTQTEMREDEKMDSKSASFTESFTTQTDMTEDQEMDSKSVSVTESIATQTEMIEDQEMDSKSATVTESITAQTEMIENDEKDSKSAPLTESITTQTEMMKDQEMDANSTPGQAFEEKAEGIPPKALEENIKEIEKVRDGESTSDNIQMPPGSQQHMKLSIIDPTEYLASLQSLDELSFSSSEELLTLLQAALGTLFVVYSVMRNFHTIVIKGC